MGTKELGRIGEEWASRWLVDGFGMVELSRNWRYKRGELDLVMRDEQTAVFVEVKVLKVSAMVPGYYRVTRRQRDSLRRTALAWLAQSTWRPSSWRFDMLALYHVNGDIVDWEYHPGVRLFGKFVGLR